MRPGVCNPRAPSPLLTVAPGGGGVLFRLAAEPLHGPAARASAASRSLSRPLRRFAVRAKGSGSAAAITAERPALKSGGPATQVRGHVARLKNKGALA